MTGRLLDAATAAEWGLVEPGRAPTSSCAAEGMKLAAQIAAKSPLAVANAKDVMNTIWAAKPQR